MYWYFLSFDLVFELNSMYDMPLTYGDTTMMLTSFLSMIDGLYSMFVQCTTLHYIYNLDNRIVIYTPYSSTNNSHDPKTYNITL